MEAIFQTADKISAAPPRSREEELEARINEQAAEIERRDALIEELRESPLPERASMDNLKQSERLMFLARINDLTLANQALEIEHHKTIKAMQEEIESLQDIAKEHEGRLEYQSKWIAELRFKDETKPELGPKQRDRREILQGLLVLGGGKMFASDVRKKMGMDEASFSRLISKMEDVIEVKKSQVNKRKNLLILRSAKG